MSRGKISTSSTCHRSKQGSRAWNFYPSVRLPGVQSLQILREMLVVIWALLYTSCAASALPRSQPARSTRGWRKLQSAALQDPPPRFGVPQRGLGYVDTTAGNAFYPWSCAGSCAGGIFWATLKRLQLCLRDTGASAESAERSRQHQHGRTGHYPAPANDTALHSCAGRPAEPHHAAAKHHRSPRSQGGIRGC